MRHCRRARTNSPASLGIVLGLFNLGAVAGGGVMTLWGGTRPRIHAIMIGLVLGSFFILLLGMAREPVTLGACLFLFGSLIPVINASFFSMLQAKVAPDLQGRVFSAIAQVTALLSPLAYLLAGPLADHVFEPARAAAGWHWIAPLVGNEKGAGIGLLFVLSGVSMGIASLAVYALPAIRNLEATLPDRA